VHEILFCCAMQLSKKYLTTAYSLSLSLHTVLLLKFDAQLSFWLLGMPKPQVTSLFHRMHWFSINYPLTLRVLLRVSKWFLRVIQFLATRSFLDRKWPHRFIFRPRFLLSGLLKFSSCPERFENDIFVFWLQFRWKRIGVNPRKDQ
jgi:hypothetical protein